MTAQTENDSDPRITVKSPDEDELEELGVFDWPIWTKEESSFDWHYDQEETCYFLEGDVEVETDEGTVTMGEGDLVTFEQGLSCKWHVKEDVRKHYTLG
jgi:uncharacterized cupin superfamily protein